MPDNIPVTPGAGAVVRGKVINGVLTQIIQVDLGGESAELLLVADPTYGVPVYITKFPTTAVIVNNPTAANLKVDASGATVPISAASAIPVSAPNSAPVAVRIANGASTWIDTLPVSGTVTANQGTAAVTANAWPTIITDGTNVAQVDPTSHGLKVYIAAGGGGGVAQADNSSFTESTTSLNVIGGEYNSSAGAVTTGKAGAVQITQYRGLHVNLRAAGGTEIGSAASPLRVDPVGTTTQPVSGTVTAKIEDSTGTPYGSGNPLRIDPVGTTTQPVSGTVSVNLRDNTGTAYSPANVLYVSTGGRAQTRVTNSLNITASQTGDAVWTPATGKAFYIRKVVLAVSTAGRITLFDQTNSSANIVFDGVVPIGFYTIAFDEPWPSAAVNNILKYTSDSTAVGTITTHGFEA